MFVFESTRTRKRIFGTLRPNISYIMYRLPDVFIKTVGEFYNNVNNFLCSSLRDLKKKKTNTNVIIRLETTSVSGYVDATKTISR